MTEKPIYKKYIDAYGKKWKVKEFVDNKGRKDYRVWNNEVGWGLYQNGKGLKQYD